ncbi:MAG: serine/threonine-protein kinase [Anaerolineae bacterium]
MKLSFEKPQDDINRTQALNPTRLNWLVGLGWLLVAASVSIALINVPLFYDYVINGVRSSPALSGVSPEFIAVVRSLIRHVGELAFFVLSVAILLRSRNLMAVLLAMAAAPLAVTLSGAYIEVEQALPMLAIPLHVVTGLALILGALLLFTLPDGVFVPRWSRYLLPLLVISESLRLTLYGFLNLVSTIVLMLPVLLVFAVAIWAQVIRYRRETPVYQHQFKWIILGACASILSIIIGQACYVLVPRDYIILTAGIDEIGSLVLVTCMIFAVTRYRLYDINLFIHRTIVYWAVFTVLGLLFAGQFVILRNLLDAALNQPNHPLGVIIPLLVTAALFPPLRLRIQRVIDHRLYHFRFAIDQVERAQQPLEIKRPGQYTGKVIGGFELRDVIGKGGMGEVYKGLQGDTLAAVKVLDPVWEHEPQVKARFEREGTLTAALNHPNIVKTYRYGVSDGVHYVALEYINGPSLTQLLQQRGRLPLDEVMPMFLQLGDALEVIHQRGIVHRDLKPSNVMLRANSDQETFTAVLMDFGIAKTPDDSTLFNPTSAIGTIHYMSPEQIQASEAVDYRADIYGMGVLLYEVLTGETPFNGSVGQILFAHLHQPPPNPCDLMPELPPQVGYVVMRALSKEPDYRFDSAREMVETLRLAQRHG